MSWFVPSLPAALFVRDETLTLEITAGTYHCYLAVSGQTQAPSFILVPTLIIPVVRSHSQ